MVWTGNGEQSCWTFNRGYSSYTNTARAFSQEWTMRNMSVDPDLDEVLSRRGRDALVNGADPLGNGYIEADKGETRVLDIQRFCSYHALHGVR